MTTFVGAVEIQLSSPHRSSAQTGRLLCGSLLLLASPPALADVPSVGTPLPAKKNDQKSASAEVKVEATDKGRSIRFVVSAGSGLKLNFEGPWRLQTSGVETEAGDPGIFGKDAFTKSPQVARLTVKLAKKPNVERKGAYKLTYFICDDPTTWCKRATIDGTFEIAVAR